jgi:hypothetical protein
MSSSTNIRQRNELLTLIKQMHQLHGLCTHFFSLSNTPSSTFFAGAGGPPCPFPIDIGKLLMAAEPSIYQVHDQSMGY